MNTKNILSMSAVAALAILTVGVFQLTEVIAEDQDKGYKFAEGAQVTARFFHEDSGIERIIPFEVIDQSKGFDREFNSGNNVIVKLEKVVGDTPYLHAAVDKAYKFSMTPDFNYNGKFFDIDVWLHSGETIFREFQYRECQITDYNVATMFDKEEGWIGKTGFVQVDKFEFTCTGYHPNSPMYEEMSNNYKKGNSISTMDLKEPVATWEDHKKYQYGPLN